MKIAKVIQDGKEAFGVVNDEFFFKIKSNTKNKIHTLQELIILINQEINNSSNYILEVNSLFEGIGLPLTSLKLLPPTTEKNKIICVGINYPKLYNGNLTTKPDHIILFSKFYDTLVGNKQALLIPTGKAEQSFDYEGEIAIVIGKPGFNITEEHAAQHIFGFTLFNDGSVREWQNHSIEAGKNFYNSGSCGPFIVTTDEISSYNELNFKTRLNGKLVQNGNLNEMFFDINKIISYVSNIIPLRTGDIIATGSPEGTGASQTPKRFLKEGDEVEISSEVLGTLTNTVKKMC